MENQEVDEEAKYQMNRTENVNIIKQNAEEEKIISSQDLYQSEI